MNQRTEAFSTVNGPYEIIDVKASPKNLLTLPYAAVMGSQIVATVTDNFAAAGISLTTNSWAIAEISLFGSVGGFPSLIKIGQCRMLTGPLYFTVPYDKAFDFISISARNMSGGRRQPVSFASTVGASLKIGIHIQPRGGFKG